MKGPQKIKRGGIESFKKRESYMLSHDNGKQIFGHSTAELEATAALRRDIERPGWHSSLSLPTGETLSEEEWTEIGRDYMREMGFDDAFAYQIYLHDKECQQHIHLVACRVGIDGRIYYGKNENLKSTKICKELEKKYKLTDTSNVKSKNSASDKKLTRQEIEKSLRTGEAPARLVIAQKIEAALVTAKDEKALFEEIKKAGVIVSFSKNGAPLFTYDDVTFSKTKLGYPAGFFRNNGNANKTRQDEKQLNEDRTARTADSSTTQTGQSVGGRGNGFPYPRPSGWGDEMASAVDAVESGWTKKAGTDCRISISVTSRPTTPPPTRYMARDLRAWRSKKTGWTWFYTNTGLPTSIFLDEKKTAVCTKSEFLTREKATEMLMIAVNEFEPPLTINGDRQFVAVMRETAKELGIEIEAEKETEREKKRETETEVPRNRPRIRA